MNQTFSYFGYMKLSRLCAILLILSSCGPLTLSDNSSDSLATPKNEKLSTLELKLVGKWDMYRVSELENAMPLYSKNDRDNFYVSRKHDWMEFSSNRTYRECYFGETDTSSMWFEADDVTMRYSVMNVNDDILRIEHYDFKGADTLYTSMDNAQFVWVKR